ncbi:MAG: hypothetical protein JNK79_15685 [Chitinophagaceae bacterium]|nr:hypothetical protein [Chitinophagaceae bacterium]
MKSIEKEIIELAQLFQHKKTALLSSEADAYEWGKFKNAEMHFENFKVMFQQSKVNIPYTAEIAGNFKKAADEIKIELDAIKTPPTAG